MFTFAAKLSGVRKIIISEMTLEVSPYPAKQNTSYAIKPKIIKPVKAWLSLKYLQTTPDIILADDSAKPNAIPAYIGLPGNEVVLKHVTQDPNHIGIARSVSKIKSFRWEDSA